MQRPARAWLLLVPAAAAFCVLLFLPLLDLLQESFRQFTPGRVGAAPNAPFTLENYLELLKPAYADYLLDTFRIGAIATAIGLVIGFPIAHYIARRPAGRWRKFCIGFLVAMMFLNALVRVYAIALTFGTVGFLRALILGLGLNPNGAAMTETLVILGLLHYLIPISALTMISTVQNVSPRLAEAAQALGAPRWRAHLTTTLPLSAAGIMSAFLICYTLCISAFVIPMVLGKGRVLFVSNLIYARFSEVADYPSGAAMSMILLTVAGCLVYVVTRAVQARWAG